MRVFVVMISLLSGVISQKNLAPNGTASQSTTYYYNNKYYRADLAISGGRNDIFHTSTCSITFYTPFQRFAWWMLTFPVDTVYVTNVTIYYRESTLTNLAGYSIYISNSSTPKTGHLCYHHTGSELQRSANCNYIGKNIIFYNERMITTNKPLGKNNYAIVELCYIEVNGCYKSLWGNTCRKPCPATCVSGHCYPSNGTCVWGCNADNCRHDTCDTVTGNCTQGCKIGRRGDYCEEPCAPETFGNQCSGNCHCANQTCNPINGTCPAGGCKRGYKGDTCSTECGPGRYGYNCNQSCDGCLSDSCDKEDGVCTNRIGCKPGRQLGQAWKCDKECVSKTFGNGCSSNCHCVNQTCNHVNGTCPAGGCKRGYEGNTCSTECSHGRYDFNCNTSCDGCLSDDCDTEYGVCTDTSGCKPGWQYGHSKCDKACDDGTFGDRCPTKCYCESEVCNKITGKCPHERCQRGWMGETCSEECSRGFYGFNCANICNTCNITLCERFEGNCTHGCMEGYTGYQCLSSVKSLSDGPTTCDNTMTIVYTGVVTFIVTTLMCVIIFLVILRRGTTCGDTKKQNGQNTRGYLNDVFTNDYADIGSTESHYEETIPSSEENNYDKI